MRASFLDVESGKSVDVDLYIEASKNNGVSIVVLEFNVTPNLESEDPFLEMIVAYDIIIQQLLSLSNCEIIIATGSELHLAVEAQKELKNKGVNVRVVSIPSWELFERCLDEELPRKQQSCQIRSMGIWSWQNLLT
jgi:transketolase